MSALRAAAEKALEALQATMDETNVNLSQNFDARNALRDALEAEKSMQERYAEAVHKHLMMPMLQQIMRDIGCHCPPDECQAPVIMGRQTRCLRKA